MSTLVAIAYPDSGTAEQVRTELIQATKEHLLTLEDAVVVVHEPDGKIKLRQGVSATGVGAAGGALWGGSSGCCSSRRFSGWPSAPQAGRPPASSPIPESTTTS